MIKKFPPAVIVGLNDASMSLVRSLGRRGIQIIGLYDNTCQDYYVKSKYCSTILRSHLYDRSLVDSLIQNVAGNLKESAVLFCTNDNSVLTVSKYAEQLKPFFQFVLPAYEVTSDQISKKKFYNFALKNSFLVPKTFFIDDCEEVEKAAEIISFPCIIKPEFRNKSWSEKVPVKVLYAESKESFVNLVQKYQIRNISIVVQEWIEGGDCEVYFCLAYIGRNHHPLAVCVAKKLRQYPHLTGSTSIAETVNIPQISVEALRLLNAAKCVGFCSVEFKQSMIDGRFYVTEPTIGRPDTQEGICLSAGVDIPWVAYLDAIGGDVPPLLNFRKGVKWINEPLEFYSLQEYVRSCRNLREFISTYRGNRSYALWAWDDPIPSLFFFKEKMEKGIRKILGSKKVGWGDSK